MDQYPEANDHAHVAGLLDHDEPIEFSVRATSAVLAVTRHRVAVAAHDRVALDVPFSAIRRVQFDIERGRPATFVVVPDDPRHDPQVLSIPVEEYDVACRAIALIGRRIAIRRTVA